MAKSLKVPKANVMKC